MTLKDILKEMLQANASDLHLKVGTPPTIRVHGALRPIGTQTISGEHLRTFATQVLSERQQKALLEGRELDCALSVAGLGRFRCNVYYQRATPAFAIRRIPLDIRSIREWNLPPVVEELALRPRGLVLVTGITGQGKSTTIAAMIQHLNLNERRNIVTIEDPIEFLFRDHLSLISQREVGSDTRSFASALRHVLRQDPDVIMVGEIRDPETMDIVLKVADTGHLVFSTLHTPNAHQTIQRMLAFFPPHEHEEVRHRLAENVAGIVSMRLVPTVEGEGRVPACEVLVSTEAVREHIRDPVKVTRLPTLIEEGHVQYGMQSFDQALMKLYREGLVTYDEARRKATRPADFELQVRGVESASDTRWTQLTG